MPNAVRGTPFGHVTGEAAHVTQFCVTVEQDVVAGSHVVIVSHIWLVPEHPRPVTVICASDVGNITKTRSRAMSKAKGMAPISLFFVLNMEPGALFLLVLFCSPLLFSVILFFTNFINITAPWLR
jgi:hypothetical protein